MKKLSFFHTSIFMFFIIHCFAAHMHYAYLLITLEILGRICIFLDTSPS